VRLAGQTSQVARELYGLYGRAAARLAGLLAVPVSRSTALRHLRRLPLPQQAVPRVIGKDLLPQSGPRRRRPPRHHPTSCRRLLLTDPENLRPKETALLEQITAACPAMTALANLIGGFAALLKPG
jgi:hypothetical protein